MTPQPFPCRGFRRVFYHALPEAALAFHHRAFRKTSTADMLKTMKMSKSGKAAAAKAEEPVSAPTAPKSLFQAGAESPLINTNTNTPNRLSTLATVAASPATLANLPQLPLSGTIARETTPTSTPGGPQHEALLKLLIEQRSRDLLTMAGSTATTTPAAFPAVTSSIPTNDLQRLVLEQRARHGEQQLLQLARQGLAEQQKRNEAALQMAILSMRAQARRDQTPL